MLLHRISAVARRTSSASADDWRSASAFCTDSSMASNIPPRTRSRTRAKLPIQTKDKALSRFYKTRLKALVDVDANDIRVVRVYRGERPLFSSQATLGNRRRTLPRTENLVLIWTAEDLYSEDAWRGIVALRGDQTGKQGSRLRSAKHEPVRTEVPRLPQNEKSDQGRSASILLAGFFVFPPARAQRVQEKR